jgi:uncharacterized protein with PQ loop repeat
MLRKPSLETLVLVMGGIEPLFTLPQAYNVWVKHETAGVSLVTWIFFTVAAMIWLFYGFSIKSKPLIVSYALYTILNSFLVVGLLVY